MKEVHSYCLSFKMKAGVNVLSKDYTDSYIPSGPTCMIAVTIVVT
jgi:hypothetical protein